MRATKKFKTYLFFISLIVSISSVMLYSVEQHKVQQQSLYEQKVLQEAIAHFDNMLVMRSWAALYGGVYVKPTATLTPNPYLKDNTLQDAQGNTLIKINPAWMTRQISEISNQKSQYHYKITSLNPINPNNAADPFETQALTYLKAHTDEKYYYRLNATSEYFDFMGVLKLEPACLACHQNNNYKIGDIRGGIRVSIPSKLLHAEIQSLQEQTLYSQLYILLSTLIIFYIFHYFLRSIYRYQAHIEQLNQSLTHKVKQRTLNLEHMYENEKYIKGLLKTVTNINALLLSSISVQSTLDKSVNQLLQHKHYYFTWIGLLKNDVLEITHNSDNIYGFPLQPSYSLSEPTDPIIHNALAAIKQKSTVINFDESQPDAPYWQASIPLLGNEKNDVYGVFNIYSHRKAGFEQEEVELLEQLSTDISLVIHSFQQQATLDQMEIERISNYEETILAFVTIIEQRDTYTAGHTLRVAEYSKQIALTLGISSEEISKLVKASVLHDIGKVATPDAVLLKPGLLTPLEFDLIKQHVYAGFNMLSKIAMYQELADIILYHHARYDGNGYPKTQSPDEVPFLSFIMAVADSFDAMTSNRIYKPKKTVNEALDELQRHSGSQFHPKVVTAALSVLKQVKLPTTSQAPHSELEKKRFSYFFVDPLTDLYNENYLRIILSNEFHPYTQLTITFLHGLSYYNKTHGWEEGNQLLIQLAERLKQKYPEAMIFRYHADDFFLLFKEKINISMSDFNQLDFLKDKKLSLLIRSTAINGSSNMHEIYHSLSPIIQKIE